MRYQDIRLSKHFVLLDFMQDRDLYTSKKPLEFEIPPDEIANGTQLCLKLLEPMIEVFGPCSLAAGYCPEGTGHYTSSPHSWKRSTGTGCDAAFHDWVNLDKPPIKMMELMAAHKIPFERMITYAGSEYLCISWKASNMRYALYENVRFIDGRKPQNLQHSRHAGQWFGLSKQFDDRPNWRRGPNEPVFHTMRQLRPQHVRLGRYFSLLDFCRSEQAMERGMPWVPPIDAKKQAFFGRMFAEVLDPIVEAHGRISVTQGMTPQYVIQLYKLDDRFRWYMGEAVIKFLLPQGVEDITPPQHPAVLSWQEEWHDSGTMEVTMAIKEFTPQTIYSGGFPYSYYAGKVPDYLPARVRARLAKERNGTL